MGTEVNTMNSIELQKNFQLEQFRSNLRMQEEEHRQEIRALKQGETARQKLLLREEERERKKAQFDMITIAQDGTVRVKTQNLFLEGKARAVVNFLNPKILIFRRIEQEDERIYLFEAKFQSEKKFALLEQQKCGNPTYLLRKISSIGGQFFVATVAQQKTLVLQLFSVLVMNSKMEIWIPDEPGWYFDENDSLKFFSGRWTWKEALKCTR